MITDEFPSGDETKTINKINQLDGREDDYIEELLTKMLRRYQKHFDVILSKYSPLVTSVPDGEESTYATNLIKECVHDINLVHKMLQAHKTFVTFSMLYVGAVFYQFEAYILKIKKLASIGAQQLMLDITSLFTVFKSKFGEFLDEDDYNRFVRMLRASSTEPESVLRMILIPEFKFMEVYNGNSKKSILELVTIMRMKGFPDKTQQEMISKLIIK